MTPSDQHPSPLTRLFLWHLNRKMTPQAEDDPAAPRSEPGRAPMPDPRMLARLRTITGRPSFPQILSSLQIRRWRAFSVPGAAGARPARLYRPRGRVRGAILFLHGGGFVHCDLVSHHGICCRLARQSGAMVLSLDYRLAPEHRFPAGLDDAWAALQWLAAQMAGRGPIAVAGDSAGGNLAAVLAHRARDLGAPSLAAQLLIYPSLSGSEAPATRAQFADGYLLTARGMAWYGAQYVTDAAALRDPRVAPLLAASFAALAPCAILTAGFDPMRGEGEQYRDRLTRAGVPVAYRCYPRMVHGFVNFYAVLRDGRAALRYGGRFLKRRLAPDRAISSE